MKKPNSFILYPNQWEPLSCLSDEQLGRLFRHIFCWLNDGSLDMKTEEQLVEPDILLAFRFMRMQIEIDIEKYEKRSEKNKQYYQKMKEKKFSQIQTNSDIKEKEIERENEKEKEMEMEMEMEKEKEKEKENSSIAAKDINNSNGEAVNESAAAADFSSFLEKMRKDFLPRAETILWEC